MARISKCRLRTSGSDKKRVVLEAIAVESFSGSLDSRLALGLREVRSYRSVVEHV
jgi:hypothetical protein